ncbi:hypothetical protein HID58_007945 [Brassica napus]|uniref:ACT-like domain-containing protein n=2 Tax=Brassica TaxID=3705 RepID=A0ABQ7XHY9_BRANA|nr:hypothetical protein HID58_095819 [Brassica napus]KAH0855502.1 hypothetical protein HID58_007945 [Brassica napus]
MFVGVPTHGELKTLEKRMESSQLRTRNLTTSDLVRDYLRYLMGERSSIGEEILCQFSFPERHGALINFLDSFSPRWNISLFHYRAEGGAGANVLVGIQVPEQNMAYFRNRAQVLGYEYVLVIEDTVFKLLMH